MLKEEGGAKERVAVIYLSTAGRRRGAYRNLVRVVCPSLNGWSNYVMLQKEVRKERVAVISLRGATYLHLYVSKRLRRGCLQCAELTASAYHLRKDDMLERPQQATDSVRLVSTHGTRTRHDMPSVHKADTHVQHISNTHLTAPPHNVISKN